MLKSTFTTKVIEEKPISSTGDEQSGKYYKIALEPLEQGYGNTLGNSLRRVLLNSIEGAGITKVKIKGVNHQFTTLEGMSEDIVEFILNVKKIRLSIGDQKSVTLKVEAKGPGVVQAKDIKLPAGVTIANPNLVLATLAEKKTTLSAEMEAQKGVGYTMVESNSGSTLGEIPLDTLFSPITRVAYKVEATRVGRRTDFDKLILKMWTDGTIEAIPALERAAKILVNHFRQIYKPTDTPQEEVVSFEGGSDENLTLTVEELDIPTRIANALRKGGYKTVEDLAQSTRAEVAKVKNLGEKSVDSVGKALEDKGFSFSA